MSALAAGLRPGRAASVFALLGFLAAALLVGSLGALVTLPAIPGWYALLAKPVWTPPNAVFGPAWTTLYLLMSIAAWLVWRHGTGQAGVAGALRLYWLQLALNMLWSPLFFGVHRTGWSLVDLLLMDVAVISTIVAFRRVRGPAWLLLLPYLAWICYATALNAAIWRMNG